MASPNVLASRSVTQNFPAGVSVGQTLTWDGNFWAPGAGSGTVVSDVDPVAAPPAEGMFGWNRVLKSLWIYDVTNGWVKLIGCLLALLVPCSIFAADTGGSIQRNFATTNDAPTLTNIVIALGTGGTGVAVAVNTNAVAVTNGSVVTISGVTDTNAVRGLVSAATNYAALVVGVGATNYTVQATNDAAVNARAYANAATNSLGTNNRLVPALPSDATQFLNGTGAFSVPAGGGGSGTLGTTNTTFYVTTVGSITFQGTNGVVLGTWTNGNFVIGTNLYVVGSLNVGTSSVTSTTGSTNTFTFLNQTTAQILAQFGTNGLIFLGTNNQFKLDTSGNVVITGSYYGLDTSLTNASGQTIAAAITAATNANVLSATTAGGAPPTGTAAGSLTGTYPNPGIGAGIDTSLTNAAGLTISAEMNLRTNSPAVVFEAANLLPGANLNGNSITGGVWRVDVPGYAMLPADSGSMSFVTNTPAATSTSIQGAGPSRMMYQVTTTGTNVFINFPLPYNYDGGTVTAELWFCGGTNGVTKTTNVVNCAASVFGTALGTAVKLTNRVDTVGVSTFWTTNSQLGPITIAGTPTAGRSVTLQFSVFNTDPQFSITNTLYCHHASVWGTCSTTQRGSIVMP